MLKLNNSLSAYMVAQLAERPRSCKARVVSQGARLPQRRGPAQFMTTERSLSGPALGARSEPFLIEKKEIRVRGPARETTVLGKKSILRKLLAIKGVSNYTAHKLCILLGLSPKTNYEDVMLNPQKVEKLNLLLTWLSKVPVSPFQLGSRLEADRHDSIGRPEFLFNKLGPDAERPHSSKISPLGRGAPRAPKKGPLSDALRRYASKRVWHNPTAANLKSFVKQNVKFLIDLNSYRGRRHKFGYPSRGQRTRSNANSSKRCRISP